MAKVSLEIHTTDNYGKKSTTNIGYINPEVENSKLKTFAQMLIAFTSETYSGATKITKESVI